MSDEIENDDLELDQDNEVDEQALEAEARQMGWVPETEFKGRKDKWIPAADYVERGKHVIPIMQATNKRLSQRVLTTDQELGKLRSQVDGQNELIDKLTRRLAQQTKRDLEVEKRTVVERIAEARRENDTDTEFQLTERLEDIRKEQAEIDEELAAPAKPKSPPTDDKNGNKGYSPEMNEWLKSNPWYGQDKEKTKAYNRLAEDLRDEGETAKGADFFAILDEEYAKRYGDDGTPAPKSKQKPQGKVESGNSRGGGPAGNSGQSAKGWNSLPKEAKEACLEFADGLVGEGKKYKTLDDWKTQYTKDYFATE